MTESDAAAEADVATGMTWEDVLADPSLRDLPYKIELSEHGKIVMSPASIDHTKMAILAMEELVLLYGGAGHAFLGVAVQCTNSHRVIETDAGWGSDAWFASVSGKGPAQRAPEHCVEVMSPSNTRAELVEKARLCLDAGAKVVWIIDRVGAKTIYTNP